MAVSDLVQLTKPRIVVLSSLLSAAGYMLAGPEAPWPGLLISTLGAALAVASASAFNMALESDTDARMARTRNRPLPAGRVSSSAAYVLAALAGVLGLVLLAFLSAAAFAVTAASLIVYAFVYTPLKRRTAWAFLAGIGPGAAPPLIGWSAAMGEVGGTGLLVFLWLLAWQIPHIMTLYCALRTDYGAAGIPVPTERLGDRLAMALSFPFTLATAVLAFLFGQEMAAGGALQAAFVVLGVGLMAGHARILLGSGALGFVPRFRRLTLWYASGITCALLAMAGVSWL